MYFSFFIFSDTAEEKNYISISVAVWMKLETETEDLTGHVRTAYWLIREVLSYSSASYLLYFIFIRHSP